MATINPCVPETMQDHGKCHTEEHKVNLLLTNCNQTLETFYLHSNSIYSMFSEYPGSSKGRKCIRQYL